MNIPTHELESMLKSGWQSWSYESYYALYPLKIPQCIYPPKKYEKLPQVIKPSTELKRPAHGWCSWYAYGWDINENKILENAVWMSKNREFPLEYVLIDHGWCLWGDWLIDHPRRFPNGLKHTANRIKALGLKVGVWLGPFMVHPRSKIAKAHPEWVVRKNGVPVDGFRITPWDTFFPYKKYILDVQNPKVQKYIKDSIDRLIKDVGVDMLKFDFMYSIYYHPNLSIEQADKYLHDLYDYVKKTYPHIYTIACGSPLLPSLGVVDSIRLSSDSIVSPFVKFFPLSKLFDRWYIHKRVIRSLSERSWTKKYWNIDPDAIVCRKNSGLTDKQILDHIRIAKECGGNIFLGDRLDKLPRSRIEKFLKPLLNSNPT